MKISFKYFFEETIKQIPNGMMHFLNPQIIKENLQLEYKQINNRLIDVQWAESFRNVCLIENTTAQDYLYKEIVVNQISLIISIRFRGGDINFPFVEILFFDSDFNTLFSNWALIREAIHLTYHSFSFKFIRILIPTEFNLEVFPLNKEIDLHIMVGETRELSKLKSKEALVIEKIDHLPNYEYEKYILEYDLFHTKCPNLSHVKPTSHKNIESLCESEIVCKIYKETTWIGLIIVAKDFLSYLYGYAVFEKIIFDAYNGNNFSAIAQNLIIQNYLPQNKNHCIIGTIDAQNFSSYYSALKSGRKNVLNYYFIK